MKQALFPICIAVFMVLACFELLAQEVGCVFKGLGKELRVLEELDSDEQSLLQVRVVVHIVYQEEMAPISDQQIYSQLAVLNQDFQMMNEDRADIIEAFKSLAANSRIAFTLAKVDEEGNPTNGITRTLTNHGPFGNNDVHYSSRGGKDGWDATRYLNVWVCKLAPGTLGYGTPPGTEKALDGVVINFEAFGTSGTAKAPYNGGRTMTHETGHWLGLQHPWGFGGDCKEDDGIADTPLQSAAVEGCDISHSSCGSQDMVQNFMNVSADDCLHLFTAGQASAMRRVLLEERKEVLDTTVNVLEVAGEVATSSFSVLPEAGVKGWYRIKIQAPFFPLKMEVRDGAGRGLVQQSYDSVFPSEGLLIDLSNFPQGIYIIRILNRNKSYSRRILNFR